ncbi:MAG TPA: proton-conducting transporter membrane subunit [Syntrophomonadaceae bacterium]|nr:proton-conducting transporter membrane subunit [Syntrophomonadaceae bacterium]
MLLLMLIAIPFIGTLALVFTRDKSINIPFITSFIVLVLGIIGLKDVFSGMLLKYEIPFYGPFVMTFQADPLSTIFVILAAFIWCVVTIYAPKYMEHEGGAWGFNLCTLLTFSAVLGVFLAGDLVTMLLFFELMTITSYFWVIHRWNKEAIKAGYFYLFFSIVGGLLIALGIVMMGAAADVLPSIGIGIVIPLNPSIFAWSIVIFIAGFGIKAGMVPLHLWLPHAHSVSPTPSSALLSGLLIKVGAYGLIRIGEFVGWGAKLGSGISWLGSGVIVLGTCTMLLGVIAALIQSDAKRLLAYHSISQMGYIILGLGVSLYLGSDGGFGLLGAIYHIINHGLFKVALFLGVGVIYVYTKETNLYKLGGLWRRFPVTALLMLLAVLGITGAPGLNGYASKSLLHHAVSQAAETGTPWLIWVERLFLLVGIGTAASFSKLYYLMFLGKPTDIKVEEEGGSPKLQIAMGLLAIVMLVIGLKPELLLNIALVPAATALGMAKASQALVGLSFWNFKDIIDMVITLSLGILVCWAGLKSGAFHWHPPIWLTLEGLVKLIVKKYFSILGRGREYYQALTKSVGNLVRTLGPRLFTPSHKFDQSNSRSKEEIKFIGISADAAILMGVLMLLIALSIFINPGIDGLKLP